jgi:hypothetical protein
MIGTVDLHSVIVTSRDSGVEMQSVRKHPMRGACLVSGAGNNAILK